jgi:hypothetical protein
MNDTIDLLQVKIEKAKMELAKETLQAINNVDWKNTILAMQESKKLNFEQTEDLLTETELLLCGLVTPENFPKEITTRLKIPQIKTDEIVNHLNEKVFKKIRQELIKIKELNQTISKEIPKEEKEEIVNTTIKENEDFVLKNTGIDILPEEEKEEVREENLEEKRDLMMENIEKPEEIVTIPKTPNMLERKFTGSFYMPTTETAHTELDKKEIFVKKPIPKIDPYREIPE